MYIYLDSYRIIPCAGCYDAHVHIFIIISVFMYKHSCINMTFRSIKIYVDFHTVNISSASCYDAHRILPHMLDQYCLQKGINNNISMGYISSIYVYMYICRQIYNCYDVHGILLHMLDQYSLQIEINNNISKGYIMCTYICRQM
jgi:hypothetical protein